MAQWDRGGSSSRWRRREAQPFEKQFLSSISNLQHKTIIIEAYQDLLPSLSKPEKMMSQSLKSSGLHCRTTSSPSSLDIGIACFHFTASLYFLPADCSEAPTACKVKCEWRASSRIKRWPTEPVAPNTP